MSTTSSAVTDRAPDPAANGAASGAAMAARPAAGPLGRAGARGLSGAKLAGLAGRLLLHAALLAAAVLMILPFFWMLSTAIKPPAEVYVFPPRWVPSTWTLDNFVHVLRNAPFARYFLNSAVMSVVQTAATVVFASMAGYAFARLQWPGRDAIFWLLMAKMMIPSTITLIPLFIVVKNVPFVGGNDWAGAGGSGLLDTYAGLILPGLIMPLGIFLFRQFFISLPAELADAARVDGASELGIFWRIMLPLTGPASVAVAILTFERSWNNFEWPLVVTRTEAMRTIQIGLAHYRQEADTQWALLMAGSALAAIPVIVLFVALQRYFVRGIGTTGLKG
jgi:multiple sugar transport system permease protein